MLRSSSINIAVLLCVVGCEALCRAQSQPPPPWKVDSMDNESKGFIKQLGLGENVTVDQAIKSLIQLESIPDLVVKCATLDPNAQLRYLAMRLIYQKKSADSAYLCLSALADEDPNVNYLALLGIGFNYEFLDDPTFAIIRLLASNKRRLHRQSIDTHDLVPIACDAASILADVGYKNHSFAREVLEEFITGKRVLGTKLSPAEHVQIKLNCSIALINHSDSTLARDFLLESIKSHTSEISENAILSCFLLKLRSEDKFLQKIREELEKIARGLESDPGQAYATSVLKFLANRVEAN